MWTPRFSNSRLNGYTLIRCSKMESNIKSTHMYQTIKIQSLYRKDDDKLDMYSDTNC